MDPLYVSCLYSVIGIYIMGGVLISGKHSYVQYMLNVISIRFVLAKLLKYIFLFFIMSSNVIENKLNNACTASRELYSNSHLLDIAINGKKVSCFVIMCPNNYVYLTKISKFQYIISYTGWYT